MKKIILAIAILLTGVSPVRAAEWTKTDTAFQVTYTIFHVMDWGQTRWISNNPVIKTESFARSNPDGSVSFGYKEIVHQESNIFLGEKPHKDKVDLYFASTLVAHTAISYALPSKYRRIWQCITIGIEGGQVARNIKAGVKMSF